MDSTTILASAKQYMAEETDPSFAKEVEELIAKNDEKELFDRFYRQLEFGTGGLRGIIGGGTNRMNPTVIKKATQGLADYIIETFPEKAKSGTLKAVIAHDSRRYSDVFAEATALIFAANGFTVYLFWHCARHRSFPMQSGSLAAIPALLLPLLTIRRSIMDTKPIGMMERKLFRPR